MPRSNFYWEMCSKSAEQKQKRGGEEAWGVWGVREGGGGGLGASTYSAHLSVRPEERGCVGGAGRG